MSKSACRFPLIALYRGFFKNEKGPGTSFQAICFVEFFDKTFSFVTYKLILFHYICVYSTSYVVKCIFFFHAWASDDVWKFRILTFQNLNTS